MMKDGLRALFILSVLILAVGCASNENGGEERGQNSNPTENQEPVQAVQKQPEPVTLSLYQYSAQLTDEEFDNYFVKPLNAKYPHITLELVRQSQSGPEELVLSGTLPDLIYTGAGAIPNLFDLEALEPLEPLIKKHGLDLGRLDSSALNLAQNIRGDKAIYTLPISMNYSVLFYNRDLFDRFGVDYPADGMLWDEAISLNRRLTRVEDGKHYVGLVVPVQRLAEQLSLSLVDPVTHKATLQSSALQEVLRIHKAITEAPGYLEARSKSAPHAIDDFVKNQDIAMQAEFSGLLAHLELAHNNGNEINFDLADVPKFASAPDYGWSSNGFLTAISANSQYKEEAFQVLQFLLDNEVQAILAKYAKKPSIVDPVVVREFGTMLYSLQGKNIQAIIDSKLAPLADFSAYQSIVTEGIIRASGNVNNGSQDINTALFQAEEWVNERIESRMSAK